MDIPRLTKISSSKHRSERQTEEGHAPHRPASDLPTGSSMSFSPVLLLRAAVPDGGSKGRGEGGFEMQWDILGHHTHETPLEPSG